MRICILANSVGFKIRPPRAARDEGTFGELLLREGHDVFNASRAGVMLSEHFAILDDEVVTKFPELIIINHGIIETYPRRSVRAVNNAGIRNYYLNARIGTPYRFRSAWGSMSLFFIRGFNALTRRFAGLLGVTWTWQSRRRFLEVVDASCSKLIRETSAFIIVIGLPPASMRADKQFPSFQERIEGINEQLLAYCERHADRMGFCDVGKATANVPLEASMPDGVHFSALGHRLIYEAIKSIIGDMKVR